MNNLNNGNFLVKVQKGGRSSAENAQIESIKSITNLLLRKIEALEKDLPDAPLESFRHGSLNEILTAFEKKLINDALKKTNWSQTRAAQLLGIKLTTLNAKIKRFDLYPKNSRGSDGM